MCIVIVSDYLLRAARKSDEMLEPYEGKLSRTVLREEGGSNTTNLLDYGALVEAFDGEVVKISAKSKDFLNPLDSNMNYGDGDAPLKDKGNFIMSLLDLVVGGGGLTTVEKSVIDRCLPKIY